MNEADVENRKPSIPARIVRAVTSAYFDLIDKERVDVAPSRRRLALLGRFIPAASGVRVEATEVAGLESEWLSPADAPDNKVLLYLHGGAYVLGGCDSHRHLVSYLARAGNIRALLPEYRLAPEHPFPAAIDDAVEVYRALLADGFDAADILVAGDSAGGGLTVATMLKLRELGEPLPAAAFLLSPWLDLSASGESMQTRNEHDPWFEATDIPIVARYYCGEDEVTNPLVSPVYADMSGMPPVYIQVGNDEILLSDATRLADNIRAAGGEVDIEVWQEMWHVFQAFLLVMPESREAVAKMGAQMREVAAT
ncbi:MAG: alpha/beta hydrolase [Woeseiaceae bacterium]|nr:alpha/beta hydrolase [Woeseiaceae bacterium]